MTAVTWACEEKARQIKGASVLKDREQAANLEKALDDAGLRVQPDRGKRKVNGDLAARLRDAVGQQELEILK